MSDFYRLRELVVLVEEWARDRGIIEQSTPQAQLLKTMSELGELADATIKQRPSDVIDGLGDVLVTLIIYAKMQKVTIHECLSSAYDQIKDRRGRMVPGGAFVKEGDE
jgi:NTP pyrophosphatase (non-canonical NTP hydrolase)